MKQLFLKKEGNPGLLLFFAGWGADEHLFASPVAEGYDCMLCYDYASPAFEAAGLAGYRSIRLLGWSMGVWAAAEAGTPVSVEPLLKYGPLAVWVLTW